MRIWWNAVAQLLNPIAGEEMTRERKYRAWDKINNKFIDLHQIIIHSNGSIMAVQDLSGEQYGLHQIELTEFVTKVGDIEIWEGDIFITDRCSNCGAKYPEEQEEIYVVKWRGGGFVGENLTGGLDHVFHDEPMDGIKILGNLFENFDLVEMYYQ